MREGGLDPGARVQVGVQVGVQVRVQVGVQVQVQRLTEWPQVLQPQGHIGECSGLCNAAVCVCVHTCSAV